MDAVRTLEGEVRELIRRSGLDPARDEVAVRRLVRDAVTDYDERSMHGGLPVLDRPRRRVEGVVGQRGRLRTPAAVLRRPDASRRSGSTSPAGCSSRATVSPS